MKNNLIEVSGITSKSDIPYSLPKHLCKEICETDKLYIPCKKPNMKDISQIFIKLCIHSCKKICTPMGIKLVINGFKCIKVHYIEDSSCNNIHCAHYTIPFCNFILLKCNYKVTNIYSAIEHVSVCQLSNRSFSISTILLLCPIIKRQNKKDCCEYIKDCNDYNDYDDCYSEINCYDNDDCISKLDCNYYNKCKYYSYDNDDYHNDYHYNYCNNTSSDIYPYFYKCHYNNYK